MSGSVLDGGETGEANVVPYPVPFPETVSEAAARAHHRDWFWSVNDKESYECPDCGRGYGEVQGFDVHHDDENPRNGAPENLIGLCVRCHCWRHHTGPTLSGLSLEEWKHEFENITESEFGGGPSDL